MALSELEQLLQAHEELVQRTAGQAKAAAADPQDAGAALLEQMEEQRRRASERLERLEAARESTTARLEAEIERERETLERLQTEIGGLEGGAGKRRSGRATSKSK